MNICEMTALEISNAVKNKEISVKDAVDAFFAAIDEYDGKYHCYNTLCKKEAYERAEEVQKGIDSGKYNGRLAGVPITSALRTFLQPAPPRYSKTSFPHTMQRL